MKALIVSQHRLDAFVVGRTERSLRAFGISDVERIPCDDLSRVLEGAGESVLLALAGTWLLATGPERTPHFDQLNRSVVAFGALRRPRSGPAADTRQIEVWRRCLSRCGGDLDRRPWWNRSSPAFHTALLNAHAANECASLLASGRSLQQALHLVANRKDSRAVHLPQLDAAYDPRLRVIQLVTTIQIGGAERVALDLAEESRRLGYAACVAAFGAPTREAFPDPPDFADLSHVSSDSGARADAVRKVAADFGADVVHAHLVRASEMAAIRARGLPIVVTLHNMPTAWPAGLLDAAANTADLALACCQAVQHAAERHRFPIPIRTVWNGIDPARFTSNRDRVARGKAVRVELGIGPSDILITVIANPRGQKRLDRLPGIVAALNTSLPARRIRVVIAGSGASSDDAFAALQAYEEELTKHGVHEHFIRAGSLADVAPVLAASDVLVSASDFEGLSLAILEALAAGIPVVATDVGGTSEVAAQSPLIKLLPVNASPADFATAIAAVARGEHVRGVRLPPSFHRYRMTRRSLSMCAAAIQSYERSCMSRENGLWLVTNNFSTGGAQSSGRRLIAALHGSGIRVRAAVVQEHPDRPTFGRARLMEQGIPVTATLPPESIEPEDAVLELLAAFMADPPEVVVFWNLITSYKVLLADLLSGVRIVDVSPGEMYFESLTHYFERARPGLPYSSARAYGRLLSAAVVKYPAELTRAREVLGCTVEVIPNGVPHSGVRPVDHSRLIIGTAARLSPQKRLEDLLEALHIAHPELPPYTLRIAGGSERGSEDYAQHLRKWGRCLSIEWCGEQQDMDGFLASLDLFVMISEPSGCPNASLEAMAAGLPVIATAVGGACDQITDGMTGRLVPPRDAKSLASALVEMGGDSAKRDSYGAAARDFVRQHFSMSQMLDGYCKVLGLCMPDTSGSSSAECSPAVASGLTAPLDREVNEA